MAEIHPNDIGLATFADVGDVERLRTSAKNVVDALNEIYQNGTQGSGFGKQWYVDGENNIIMGENNIVYGNNNLIIGSDNIVVADDLNLIASNKKKYTMDNIYMDYYVVENGRIYYYSYNEDGTPAILPFAVGDKAVFSLYQCWTNSDWTDYYERQTPLTIVDILEINPESNYIRITTNAKIPTAPPDEIHTSLEYQYIDYFIPLAEGCKKPSNKTAISFGGDAQGNLSIAAGYATANGSNSFAVNTASARGSSSAALCSSSTDGSHSFAACTGAAMGEKSAALNYSQAYTNESFVTGHYSKTYAIALKCVGVNKTNKSLTIDSGYSLSGVSSGSKIIFRCFNSINTIIMSEMTVKSVSGNTIYLNDDSNFGGTGNYEHQLFPDGIIFVKQSSSIYTAASIAAGYYGITTGKYSFTNGLHVITMADNAVTFGKYGVNNNECSIALANGQSLKTPSLAFKVLSDGSVHADREYTSPCADYAEYFEWEDCNPDNDDRTGYFVKLKNGKIVLCEDFDTPLGIISAAPAIIGDSGEMHWQGKYITDDFGRVQYHEVVIPAQTDDDGNIVIEEHTETQPMLNPDWNAEQEYIPRKNRPEWSPVGVLGKLIVYDDGTLKSGDVCRCGNGGIAVKSVNNGYTVLKRVSDDKVLIWFKG